MKKILTFLTAVLLTGVCFSGSWQDDNVISAGNSVSVEVVNMTTYTATAINTQAFNNAISDFFNNTAFTIWIGSNTSNLNSVCGFPILSSTTYTLGGRFTGIVYGELDASAAGSINRSGITINYKTNQQ